MEECVTRGLESVSVRLDLRVNIVLMVSFNLSALQAWADYKLIISQKCIEDIKTVECHYVMLFLKILCMS